MPVRLLQATVLRCVSSLATPAWPRTLPLLRSRPQCRCTLPKRKGACQATLAVAAGAAAANNLCHDAASQPHASPCHVVLQPQSCSPAQQVTAAAADSVAAAAAGSAEPSLTLCLLRPCCHVTCCARCCCLAAAAAAAASTIAALMLIQPLMLLLLMLLLLQQGLLLLLQLLRLHLPLQQLLLP